jgi:hypothetical protein
MQLCGHVMMLLTHNAFLCKQVLLLLDAHTSSFEGLLLLGIG